MDSSIRPHQRTEVAVSLVIPCFNRLGRTAALLDSLARATFICQVIIVDDCSSEALQAVVEQYEHLRCLYKRNPRRRGPAASRNIGIAMATHDAVAFTDNDCLVSPDWLLHLWKSISESPAQIAGVGGRVLATGHDIYSRYYDYHKILDPWYFRGQYCYLTTANSIFKKHAVQAVRGFDETVTDAGGEDPGLCFKLLNVGYSFGYNPDAVVRHDYDATAISFLRTFYRYGFGCNRQSRRYFRPYPFSADQRFGGNAR